MGEERGNAPVSSACFISPTDKLSLCFDTVSVNVILLEIRFGYI